MFFLFFTLFCGFFIFIPGLIHVKFIKLLRVSKYYNISLFIAIIIIFISIIMWESIEFQKVKHLRFVGFAPLLFLVFYKILNNIWKFYIKRDLYFYQRYSKDYESINATWKEFFIQFFIVFSPLFICIYIAELTRQYFS